MGAAGLKATQRIGRIGSEAFNTSSCWSECALGLSVGAEQWTRVLVGNKEAVQAAP